MEGPWKHNPWYTLLRPYVDGCTRFSYRHVRVEGKENIPEDAAVIIAPNHCNTLMDALVVLRAHKGPTVFGARADIFDNKTVASILRFLRILPMVRKRDGIRKVLRNYETIDQVVDVLSNGVPFCMFAEGRHRTMHSTLPINKGIFRIAMAAHNALDGKKDVVIVPAGIEYGDYFHFRSWSRLRFGKPINVSAAVRENPDLSEIELFALLRARLLAGIRSRIVYIPDDEDYEPSWEAFERRFTAREGHDASAYRDAGLPRRCWQRLLLAALASPLFVAAALMSAPMWGLSEWLCHCKVKDTAFRNTARYGVKLIGTILFGIIWAAVLFSLLPWWAAAAGLLFFFMSYSIFYDGLNLIRK